MTSPTDIWTLLGIVVPALITGFGGYGAARLAARQQSAKDRAAAKAEVAKANADAARALAEVEKARAEKAPDLQRALAQGSADLVHLQSEQLSQMAEQMQRALAELQLVRRQLNDAVAKLTAAEAESATLRTQVEQLLDSVADLTSILERAGHKVPAHHQRAHQVVRSHRGQVD